MAHPLDSAYLKLARAAAHVQALDAETKLYLDTEPYLPLPEWHTDTGKHLMRARAGAPPPSTLSATAADAIHNLRAALDHLTYQAAGLDPGRPRGERTQYPIFDTPEEFDARIPGPYLDGVPRQLWALFRSAQPFEQGYALLAPIARLDDRDKHRVLEPMVALAKGAYVVERFDRIIELRRAQDVMDLHDGAVLLEFRTAPGAASPPLQVGMNFEYIMRFGQRGGVMINTAEVREALKMVATILLRFRPAFEPGAKLDELDVDSWTVPTHDPPPG
jgi:hypothetical protein